MNRSPDLPEGDGWKEWFEVAGSVHTEPGVHRPSEFSALLASTLTDAGGRVVVDAGCGAGLIALAALQFGARQVVAQDFDRAALSSTALNVERFFGGDGRRRLSLWEADFSQLAPLHADVLAVNPPQRPAQLLPEVEDDQRHLHEGGGEDGFRAMRAVLGNAGTREVRTTAAAALGLEAHTEHVAGAVWAEPNVIATAGLPMHPSWRPLVPELVGDVSVWRFVRSATNA